MEKRGVCYEAVYTDEEGNVSLEDMEHKIRPNTKAIIVLHASNVCGTIEIGRAHV